MSLDANPLLNEKNNPISQTQDAHIKKFNELGKVMASLADYYAAGKSGDETLIASLRQDFSGTNWAVGSDRIVYNAESLDAKIIHYFGSTVTSPVEVPVFIPDYSSGPTLNTVLSNKQGLDYIQALFNTEDDADTIKKTLTALSGKDVSKIRVWTPDQGSRASTPERAAFLGYNFDYFHVDGYGYLSNYGRSRGVSLSPAGTAPKNKGYEKNQPEDLLLDINKGTNKKAKCVYFTNTQEIKGYSRYDGLFCFYKNRFVLSMTAPRFKDEESIDDKIVSILSGAVPTSEKLSLIENDFSPVYARLQKYEQGDSGFEIKDDSEAFGEPRMAVVKI